MPGYQALRSSLIRLPPPRWDPPRKTHQRPDLDARSSIRLGWDIGRARVLRGRNLIGCRPRVLVRVES